MADLRPQYIDLEKHANRKEHHTDQFENDLLVVRRGQKFILKVTLSGEYNKDRDEILLHFSTGPYPRMSKGTMIRASTKGKARWSLELVKVEGKTLTLAVTPDASAIVGYYRVTIEVLQQVTYGEFISSGVDVPERIVVLFNPFFKGDDVYMPDTSDVEEYVMREVGFLYTSVSGGGRAWNYGQFDPDILECALYIMEKSSLATQNHGNPALVLRALSAMVNSPDDSGVLMGNWDNKYYGGTDPTTWNGSVRILQQYFKRKFPVKFGQCWVFAGVLTTVCRALGIPCRPVTNFSSGHDTNSSCTIDMFTDHRGDMIDEDNDSIWNFHVWNEAYTRRKDLPKEYRGGGWQVVDATPQESSEGTYRCGPCPVEAIKRGDIHVQYDAPFIFSEVNADQVFWRKSRYGEISIIYVDTDNVGTRILTKASGSKRWRDITGDYKNAEATKEERLIVRQAVREAVNQGTMDIKSWTMMYGVDKKDTIELHLKGKISPNEDGHFELKIENNGDIPRDLVVTMTLSPRFKDGSTGKAIAKQESKASVDPGKEIIASWNLSCKEYFYNLQDDAWLWLWAKVSVPSLDEVFTRSKLLEVAKPELSVTVDKSVVKVRETFLVTVNFTNPTSVTLTNCVVNVEGPGIYGTEAINIGRHLSPGHTINVRLELTARMPGDRDIIASFDSRQLQGISDMASVKVTF